MSSFSAALRPQNNMQKEHVRILKPQELNKVPDNSRVKQSTAHSSKRGAENKDPRESAKGVNTLTGVSRLPVLAKSLLSDGKDISPNPAHNRWEERPLLGKAQKRKTCTKPVPFNLSQSRPRGQKAAETSYESATKPGNPSIRQTRHTPEETQSGTQHRTKTRAGALNPFSKETRKEHANSAVVNSVSLSTESRTTTAFKLNSPEKGKDIASAIQKDLSAKLGNIRLANSELTKDGRSFTKTIGFEDQADCRPGTKGSVHSLSSANCKTGVSEGLGDAVATNQTPRVSTCPAGQNVSIYLPQRVSVKKKGGHTAKGVSENAVPFSPDPSALRSILLNEGVKVRDPDGATLRMSTCTSGRATSIYSAQRVPLRKPRTRAAASPGENAGSAVLFTPDPSALRSILLNEGVKQGAIMTPRACPSGRTTSIYSALRVPVKKAPSETSTTGVVSFSPDPSALRSILHNEGVKVVISAVTTPRVSVCSSGRATSIYTAQRVPVKKDRAEEAAHTGVRLVPSRKWTPQRVPVSQTPGRKWTPQRVPVSQNPGRKWTPQRVPVSKTPGRTWTPQQVAVSQPQSGEEVVQRLFQEEPEHEGNEQMEDCGEEVTPGQSLHPRQSAGDKLKHEGDTNAETNSLHSKEEKIPEEQPFIQAPHRQSVIVFSSGQKLLRRNAAQTALIQTSQHAAQLQPSADQTSRSQSELNSGTDRPVTPSKLCKTKASSLSLAVCALRRRLPPLEEMFLDEECAMYTSHQQSWPNQPRCYNPLASTLLFQDSTHFVPIIVTCSSLSPVEPSPHHSKHEDSMQACGFV